MIATAAPHPDSVFTAPDGRVVELKVHRCLWSGDYPENSLAAIEETYRAAAARAEIDLCVLKDGDLLVLHDVQLEDATDGTGLASQVTRREAESLRLRNRDGTLSQHRPPLFSEVAAAIAGMPFPTLLELDLKDNEPLPWARVEALARLVEPVKDRIVFGAEADWNLRRLLHVDPTIPVGFNPAFYLDWSPNGEADGVDWLRLGAYGYLDAHPLAERRLTSTAEYVADRLGGILRLVPGAREAHLRLATFERMLDDDVPAAALFHAAGLQLDVWTLDAGTPEWHERFVRAVANGADIITTNTPRHLAAAGRGLREWPVVSCQ